MSLLLEQYNYYIYTLGDPLLKNSILLNTPLPGLIIILIYLYLIYGFLPSVMYNREPYSLKTVIFFYNIFQIIVCSYTVYELITPISDPLIDWKCERFTYKDTPKTRRMIQVAFYTYLLKIIDLSETVFFILRKKFNQVSILHVYHHASTIMLVWFLTKYFTGGLVLFWIMLNSSVHILMYTYYLLSSLDDKWQKKINKFKPLITIVQMVQFCIMIGHSSQIITNPECNLPPIVCLVFVPNITLILSMFINFYRKAYLGKHKKMR